MQIALDNTETKMTSREIAELVMSPHDSVLKTVRRLIDEGIVSKTDTRMYKHPQNGQMYPEFLLNFRDSMVVASGYSSELRAKVVDRWMELEKQKAQQFKIPQTYSDALRLCADQADHIEAQTLLIEQQKPAVEFVDRYVESTGLKGFREVCKLLKANESHFREFLISEKIMYRLGGVLTAHQNHIDAGRFEVRTGVADSEHAYSTTKFTPKGVSWVAGEWAKHQITL